MAERVGKKIIIQRLRSGRRHFRVIDLETEIKSIDYNGCVNHTETTLGSR